MTDEASNVVRFEPRRVQKPGPEAEQNPRWKVSEFYFDPKSHRLTMTFVDASGRPIGVLGFKVDSVWPDNFDWAEFSEWWAGLKNDYGHAS